MHYKRLVAGVNAYYNQGEMNKEKFPVQLYPKGGEELAYFEALYEEKPISERIKIIVNKWGNCRVNIDNVKLQNALKIFQKEQELVLKWNLTKLSLWDNHDKILKLFSAFMEPLKYTGASKALHILNPDFFVMWDIDIREAYGCFKNEEGYFNFLLRTQRELEDVCDTYIKDFGNNSNPIKEIPKKIYSDYKGQFKTIVKLLDEYNWAHYKKKWL